MAVDEEQPGARTPVAGRTNRAHCFAGRAHEVLDDLLGADGSAFVSVADLSAAATREAIIELSRLQDRIEALKSKLLDHGDIVAIGTAPDDDGRPPATPATTTPAWLADAVRAPLSHAKRAVKLAKRLEDAFHVTGRALAAGMIDAEQAHVIVTAVDALPDIVLEHERRKAEAHLVAEAAHHDALALRKLGIRLLEVIDPDGLDEYLARKLAEEEARAERKTRFHLRRDGSGAVRGDFVIPELHAAMLETALNAIASPKRPDALPRDEVPTPEVLGQAFCEYIESYPADKLPTAGGAAATVVVTMDLETLRGGVKPALVDTGILISDGEARRLAARCGFIPAVCDSQGHVLDLGRKVRTFNTAQRIALRVKHKTCTVEGCTVPAAWCHAHHKVPWSEGGKTSVANGTLLCPRHHRNVHRPGYSATYGDDGTTRIIRTAVRRQ